MPRTRKPKQLDPSRAIALARASTDEQTISPEAQQKAMHQWAKAQGVAVVGFYCDQGISGAATIEERPGLLAAIEALADLDAGVLLVAKRDRLARDVPMAALIERLVERQGAVVRSADGVGNGSSPEDKLLRSIVDAFAAHERHLIAARTKAALAAKAARGERIGGVPYGWRLAEDGVHLDPEPEEQVIIERAAELRDGGLSLRAVGAALAGEGHRPRSGRDSWSPMSVRALLTAASRDSKLSSSWAESVS